MLKKNWEKIKVFSIVGAGAVTFAAYLYSVLTPKTSISYSEVITLPVSGISLPYWLLMGLGFILLPGLAVIIVYEILDRIEDKKF